MPTLQLLLEKGYFPAELPPPFTTASFATAISHNVQALPSDARENAPKTWAKLGQYSYARYGLFRRKLSLPNPRWHFQLCEVLAQDWADIVPAQWSKLSRSVPTEKGGSRALERERTHVELPVFRAHSRTAARYGLKTDITRFYGSIYTHSIPWAIHTKGHAKQNQHTQALVGNKLDKLVRGGQEGQTLGIPVGPDTSLLLAERLLHAVDADLPTRGIRGFRYMDDYEFAFKTYAAAEDGLAALQVALAKYGLEINPLKTSIVELPDALDPPWIRALRVYAFRDTPAKQQKDLLGFFDLAFELERKYRTVHVIPYALGHLEHQGISPSNWTVMQSLLLQTMHVDSGAVPHVCSELVRRAASGANTSNAKIRESLSLLFERHAPLGHSSEVAWALWLSLSLGIPLHRRSCRLISTMEDPIVALLALDAQSRGLAQHLNVGDWAACMTTQALSEEQWLLAYEANIRGWLPSAGGGDHIAASGFFNFLRTQKVSFYDAALAGANNIQGAAAGLPRKPSTEGYG